MSYALLFSGQGLQHAATLPWLDPAVAAACLYGRIGGDWRARLADAAWAQRNAVAQPLLTGLALAAWQQVGAGLPRPAAVAGYSVGELAAYCAAGVFDGATAIDLACRRAAAMDAAESHAAEPTGLLGISGLPPAALARLCAAFGLEVAIRTGVGTAVVGGSRARLLPAEVAARAQGAHCTPLAVALASHTSWMRGAAAAFADTLAGLPMQAPCVPLISNFAGGALANVTALRHALAAQIDHCVHWDDCVDGIVERGVRCVLELGAGGALARMWNERHPEVPARSGDDFRSAAAARAWVQSHIG